MQPQQPAQPTQPTQPFNAAALGVQAARQRLLATANAKPAIPPAMVNPQKTPMPSVPAPTASPFSSTSKVPSFMRHGGLFSGGGNTITPGK